MDRNDSYHIICKVEVIVGFADLNNRAHSGEHTGKQRNLPARHLRDQLVGAFKA